ncbi:hypothetical protein [Vibrio coralliilyticus]|uniref:hypothetical protein n=1 Tax=Vibrio coralliilyticus TaxID=190893 RepID=UPI000BAC14C3|nr:hypothetical protein [Vibrio coralliilyticus]PAW02268.1 hypothetical protein CKJ79_16540 [Vibrio coralliilyticus]
MSNEPNWCFIGKCLRPGTFTITFILANSLYNIVTTEEWMWSSFLIGLLCGLPIIYAWWQNRTIGKLLTFVGIILLGLALTGYAERASVDHIFFIGMSIGTLIGFYPGYIFNKPKSYLHVALLLLFDGYTEESKEFQKKYEDETGEKL